MGRKIGEVMSETLIEQGKENSDLVVLTSDSRGSGALIPFAEALPKQLIELGIAEQNVVSVSAGLANGGKRPFAVSPAAFLTMRSIEQVKVDVAYSDMNVKLVGISGGNSYSTLGSSHHSLQDMAITRAIPNLEVFMPSDQYQAKLMFEYLAKSNKPAYIRFGKLALPDCYTEENAVFVPGKANVLKKGNKVAIFANGETLHIALDTYEKLLANNIEATIVDMHTVKPLDTEILQELAQTHDYFVSIEEHSIYGGLGSAIAEAISEVTNVQLKIIGFPDEPVIGGDQLEVFKHYGIDSETISKNILEMME